METFAQSMHVFKKQLHEGSIQQAYQGLMEYIHKLRLHFDKKYPEFSVASGIYYGYMDMTAFYLFPTSLKRRKLKISIVFVYETFQFEIWLSGANRDIQARYWDLLREKGWDKYRSASDPRKHDYVIAHVLAHDPEWSDLDVLTGQVEQGTLAFINDVEAFLADEVV